MNHQFFYGKDENNLDKEWGYPVKFDLDGRLVSFSVTDEQTPPLRVNPGPHMTTLFVNGVPTIKNDVSVGQQEVKVVEHKGGVFRHYGTAAKINFIESSKNFPSSPYGDLYMVSPLSGFGVYLTDLNINPSSEGRRRVIARKLRLFQTTGFEDLKNTPIGLEPEDKLFLDRNSYLDSVINTSLKVLLIDSGFNNQFLFPSDLPLDNQNVYEVLKYE